jgi:CHAD domain-containing protein
MMLKARDRSGRVAVTFSLPAAVGARHAAICGEWNGWSPERDVMESQEGGFVRTVLLDAGRVYRFRYLLDGRRWENDWAADRYVPNAFGSDDSVVDLTVAPAPAVDSPLQALLRPDAAPAGPSPLLPRAAVTGERIGPALPAACTDARRSSAGSSAASSAGSGAGSSAGSSVEREAKLVAPAALGMPDLGELVPGTRAFTQPVRRLDATYYDTADLRLARSGITVRHRGGESGPAWTVKLPEDGAGSDLVRREIRFDGPPDHVPYPAADLVLASTRSLSLLPVARLTTVRRPVEIRDPKGHLLAEVVDDTVSVARAQGPVGRFREVEIELHTNGAKGQRLLDAALSRLVAAGCNAGTPMPKLVRALGGPATQPPDVVVPPLPDEVTVSDVVRHATARAVAEIIRHDPGARLGDDEEDVHKLRVAARRLRSDLHSFSPVLEVSSIKPVRAELSWLGATVGAVRDTDVLTLRLTSRLAALSGCDMQGAGALMGLLEQESAKARFTMLAALRDARYLRLLDTLVGLAAAPPFRAVRPFGRRASVKMAVRIAERPWCRVVEAVCALGTDPGDAKLHEVRILAKRSRYAAEATAPLLGPRAVRFAAAVADVQTILGNHQDTVLAEEWLHRAAAASPEVTPVVQQVVAMERSLRSVLRAQWPAVWERAVARQLR